MELTTYNECKTCSPCGSISRSPSIRERLQMQKNELEDRLKRVNDALIALNNNPETANVLELISKV